MKIVIVDNGSRHLKLLGKLCAHYGSVRVVAPDDVEGIGKDEVVVLSGSHAHYVLGSPRFYAHERQLVQSHDGPLIGICAGMELIASVYGGRLGKMPLVSNGRRTIRISDPTLRFSMGGKPTAKVAERHSWAVKDVEEPLIVVATSDAGVEALRHVDRPIVGLQFHPELSPDDGRVIFEWALGQVTNETLSARGA